MMARGGRRVPMRRVMLSSEPCERKNIIARTPDVCAEVKSILSKASNFPPEVVDIVMDLAEYWACSEALLDYSQSSARNFSIYGSRDGEDHFLLRTEPVGFTKWHPDNEDQWKAAAPACKLEEEYEKEELEELIQEETSALLHPFRKIVFDIVSRDQGHTNEGSTRNTFQSSWTWFDVGIDRFDKRHKSSDESDIPAESETSGQSNAAKNPTSVPPIRAIRPIWPPLNGDSTRYDHALHPTQDHKIQCNRTAGAKLQYHHIEWSWTDNIDPESGSGKDLETIGRGAATGDGRFLRDLKVGDMVTVWGRARFPGWTNHVQSVKVRVYWAC
ncbi:hypothetical protein GGS20DRAFT_569320 [Poronia punctata]|nr:hypothetical protein GGS20DRAFT_569320 [Poronia punctata]